MQTKNTFTNNEIEWFDLVDILWSKKFKIILFTTISILIAGIYAFTAKEEWTSNAQVIAPEPIQLGTYLEAERKFYRSELLDIDDGFNLDKTLQNAFRVFSIELNAFNNKLAYIQQSDYYKQLAEQKNSELDRNLLLRNIILDEISIKPEDNNVLLHISFTAEDPINAQKTLEGFINHSNKIAQILLFKNLFERTHERINSLTKLSQDLKKSTEQERKNKILILKQAISTATDAGIPEYTGQSLATGNTIIDFNNTDTLFLLGQKYLTSQLHALENSPLIYPTDYYRTLNNIEELKSILNVEPIGTTFKYTRSADIPLTKDKPRKAFILIFGALLGTIAGCSYVLITTAANNRKKTIKN